MPIIALVSGGVDSFIMYKYLIETQREDVIPLFIHYNGRYNDKEDKAVFRLFEGVTVSRDYTLNLKESEVGDKAFIQNRNVFFALVASFYGDRIAMAGLKDDNVGDKSPEAFVKMTELLNAVNEGGYYQVFSPFWNKEKIDIIGWYLENGFNRKELEKTVSCYSEKDTNFCGECPACFRKYCAFKWHDLPIPKFTNLELVATYTNEWKNKKGQRAQSIRKAAKELL